MFGTITRNEKQLPILLLGEICSIERGGSPRPINDYFTDDDDGINWIKIGDANESRYITKTEQRIIKAGMKKSRYVTSGDLILSNSMSFGRPYILKINGCIHDGWLVLKYDDKAFSDLYLQVFLSMPEVYEWFTKAAAGAVVSNLNCEVVRKLPIIVPSLPLQNRFAEFVRQSDKSKFELHQTLDELEATYKALLRENLG
jgi:type I restriction enzyme S subunit